MLQIVINVRMLSTGRREVSPSQAICRLTTTIAFCSPVCYDEETGNGGGGEWGRGPRVQTPSFP